MSQSTSVGYIFASQLIADSRWTVDFKNGLVIGERDLPLGTPNEWGYIRLTFLHPYTRRPIHAFAHRVIWEAANGPIPLDMVIDHLNGVRNDNRLCNLEAVTPSENVRRGKLCHGSEFRKP